MFDAIIMVFTMQTEVWLKINNQKFNVPHHFWLTFYSVRQLKFRLKHMMHVAIIKWGYNYNILKVMWKLKNLVNVVLSPTLNYKPLIISQENEKNQFITKSPLSPSILHQICIYLFIIKRYELYINDKLVRTYISRNIIVSTKIIL